MVADRPVRSTVKINQSLYGVYFEDNAPREMVTLVLASRKEID